MKMRPDADLAAAVAHGSSLAVVLRRLWERTRIDWSFASDSLAAAFRNHRELGSRERRFVAETLYGMIRHLRRIDEALDAAGVTRGRRAPDGERLVAFLVLEAGLPLEIAAEAFPKLDWPAAAGVDDRIAAEPNRARRIARRHSLPDWLADQFVTDLGDRAEAIAAALNERAPMTVRTNTLRGDRDALVRELAAEGIDTALGRFGPAALHVETRTNLFSLDAFGRGAFEAQDEGSQLIAELVAPPPRGLVVDVCAGAGGKTLALAAALDNKGRVVAADIDKRKLTELKRRAKRAAVTNVQRVILHRDGDYPGPLARLEGAADRVLVDAPCTGVGALRRNPEARWRMAPGDLERMAAVQLEIARRALSLVAPGGRLIYATCSLLRAENEAVVDTLLAEHPRLELMPAKQVWGVERAAAVCDPTGSYLRVDPATHGTDGFFAALIRKPK